VRLGTPPERFPWITVVGIVGDARHVGLDTDPRPEVYRPYALNPLGAPILVIRTAADPAPLIGLMSAKVRSVSAGVPAYNVFAVQALVDRSTAQGRFVMLLLMGFAMAALLTRRRGGDRPANGAGRLAGSHCGWCSGRVSC